MFSLPTPWQHKKKRLAQFPQNWKNPFLFCGGFMRSDLINETDIQQLLTSKTPEMKATGKVDPEYHAYDPADYYKKLDQKLLDQPNISLSELQKKIKNNGLCTILPYAKPKYENDVNKLEILYGTPLRFADYPRLNKAVQQTTLAEVALHPGNSANSARVFLGSANPHINALHGKLDKWEEYVFANKYKPGVMPPTFRLSDLQVFHHPDLTQHRNLIRQTLSEMAENRKHQGNYIILQTQIYQYLALLKTKMTAEFNNEMIMKHRLGCATGDGEGILYLSRMNMVELGDAYVSKICFGKTNDLSSSSHLIEMYEANNAIIHDCIFSPEHIILQQEVPMAAMESGKKMEFRVSFLAGVAIHACPRYTFCCYLREQKIAMDFLNDFFSCVPEQFRYLAGGADIGFNQNGKPFIVEFNFGADGFDTGPGLYHNLIVSTLKQQETPLISFFSHLMTCSASTQNTFLRSLKQENQGLTILAQKMLHYYRNRLLLAWITNKLPTSQSNKIEQFIESIFNDQSNALGVPKVTALSFIKREKSLAKINDASFFISNTSPSSAILKQQQSKSNKRERIECISDTEVKSHKSEDTLKPLTHNSELVLRTSGEAQNFAP